VTNDTEEVFADASTARLSVERSQFDHDKSYFLLPHFVAVRLWWFEPYCCYWETSWNQLWYQECEETGPECGDWLL